MTAAVPPDERLRRLLEGLDQMSPHPGISFRGRAQDASFGRPGEVVVTLGLIPTSRDARVATENFRTRSLYAVLGRSGRYLRPFSARPEEEEVLFRPGTILRVVGAFSTGPLEVTFVEEVETTGEVGTARDLEHDRQRVSAALEAARRRPEVSVPLSGKFLGDIA
jgi:hypothetical protein